MSGHIIPLTIPQEKELQTQQCESQKRKNDNRGLVQDRSPTEQERTAAKGKRRADIEIIDLDAEDDLTEASRNEVAQLRAEVKRLNTIREGLSTQVQNLCQDVAQLHIKNQEIPVLKFEVHRLQCEVNQAREAIEHEKQEKVAVMAQKQIIRNHMNTLADELKKLRATLGQAPRDGDE